MRVVVVGFRSNARHKHSMGKRLPQHPKPALTRLLILDVGKIFDELSSVTLAIRECEQNLAEARLRLKEYQTQASGLN
ncbi:MAG: hypothetical protein ABSE48_14150 [Verrucomicrobiota bacterium]